MHLAGYKSGSESIRVRIVSNVHLGESALTNSEALCKHITSRLNFPNPERMLHAVVCPNIFQKGWSSRPALRGFYLLQWEEIHFI